MRRVKTTIKPGQQVAFAAINRFHKKSDNYSSWRFVFKQKMMPRYAAEALDIGKVCHYQLLNKFDPSKMAENRIMQKFLSKNNSNLNFQSIKDVEVLKFKSVQGFSEYGNILATVY